MDAATIAASNNNGGNADYNCIDRNASADINWYRVKSTFRDGNIDFSAMVKISSSKMIAEIEVFPNPVSNEKLNISFTKMKGMFTVQLINDAGQKVLDSNFKIEDNSETKSFLLNKNISSGYYNCIIMNEMGEKRNIRLFKN